MAASSSRAFLGAVKQLGGQIVAVKSYPQDANGMLAPVREIARWRRRASRRRSTRCSFPPPADTLPALAPLLPYSEIDTTAVKVIGTSGWDYTGVGKEQALVGGWFSAPDPKGLDRFHQALCRDLWRCAAPPRDACL